MGPDGATTRTARKTDRGPWVRHALGLLSVLVLLADGTGSGQLRLSGGAGRDRPTEAAAPSAEVDGGGQAFRLEGLVGVAVSVAGHRFERAAPTDPPPSSRGRAREWDWTASRLHAEVHAIIRHFDLSAWRQRNGHVSDRPLIFTLPARGPPAAAPA